MLRIPLIRGKNRIGTVGFLGHADMLNGFEAQFLIEYFPGEYYTPYGWDALVHTFGQYTKFEILEDLGYVRVIVRVPLPTKLGAPIKYMRSKAKLLGRTIEEFGEQASEEDQRALEYDIWETS